MRVVQQPGYRLPDHPDRSVQIPVAPRFTGAVALEETSSKPGEGRGAVHQVEVSLTSLPDEPVTLTLDLRAGPDARAVLTDDAPQGCRLSEGSNEKPWTVTCTETATALTIPLTISRPNVDAGELTATLQVPEGYYAPTPPTATVPLSAIEVQEPPADPALSVEAEFRCFDPLSPLCAHLHLMWIDVHIGAPTPGELLLEFDAGGTKFVFGDKCNEESAIDGMCSRGLQRTIGPPDSAAETYCLLVFVPPGQRDKTMLTVTALDDTQRQVIVPVQPPAEGEPSDGNGG
jgi:hypothetical protein